MSKTKISRKPRFTRDNFEKLLKDVESLNGQLQTAEDRANTAEGTVEELKGEASAREKEFFKQIEEAASVLDSYKERFDNLRIVCEDQDRELQAYAVQIDELKILNERSHRALVDQLLAKGVGEKSQGGDSPNALVDLFHLVTG